MIFVTVGTQLPFDRLIKAVDEWAAGVPAEDVFAQVGPSSYRAKNIKTKPFITPLEFRQYAQRARIIVSHAGMGSILTALEFGKRLVVMPRRSDLGEHRNDHQIGTARYFGGGGRLVVASDGIELHEKLSHWNDADALDPISTSASPALITTLRHFIQSGPAGISLDAQH